MDNKKFLGFILYDAPFRGVNKTKFFNNRLLSFPAFSADIIKFDVCFLQKFYLIVNNEIRLV